MSLMKLARLAALAVAMGGVAWPQAAPPLQIEDEATNLGVASRLRFAGDSVTCTRSGSRITCTMAEGGAGLTSCVSSTPNDAYQADCTPALTAPPTDGMVITFKATAAANTGPATVTLTDPDPDAGPYAIYKNHDAQDLDDNNLRVDETYLWRFCAACDSANGAFIGTTPEDSGFAPASYYENGGAEELDLTGLDGVDHGAIAGLTDNDHPQYACPGCTSAELTLDTNGDITIPAGGGVFSLDTFSNAASDTLDTIACTAGNSFVLRAENVARVVTIAAASIPIWGDSNFAFDEAADRAFGICPATDTPYIYAVFNAAGRIDVQEIGVGTATYNIRSTVIELEVFPPGEVITTGDQQSCFTVPNTVIWATSPTPMLLTDLEIRQQNVADTTGLSVMVSRKRMSSPTAEGSVDMLSAACTTDANEFYSADDATGCTVNTSNDDVQPGDRVCVDVDTASNGEGLHVWMLFGP